MPGQVHPNIWQASWICAQVLALFIVVLCVIRLVIEGYLSLYRVVHEVRDVLSEYGLSEVCEFGAAEQGALIVDAARSYGPKYIGDGRHADLKVQYFCTDSNTG